MKKAFTIIILNLLFITCLAQTDRKLFIADSITHEPIEYASIVFVGIEGGTYSNNKGVFYIPQNVEQIELSSIGYNTKTTILQKNIDTIFLFPQVYELTEAKILPIKKKRKSVELGYAQKNSIYTHMSLPGEEIAVYIPLINNENAYRLIKRVLFKERVYVARKFNLYKIDYTSVFKINFYSVAENNEIGELINTEDIVFTSDILKTTTKLDVSKYNIYMPENGIFVAVEWVGKINTESEEIMKTDIKERILPFIRTSWEIENSIVYEKRRFSKEYGYNWKKVDKNNEIIKSIKTIDKNLKEDAFYTPLISIVLE
ncbi:MAG: carboxypeptidase-like regulatory domain-containing protein [Prevotellaceae bacterium]|jgi:hypothetical protein|nr:carboxypeptidase-like regulatory domain-containing protein [Prevotellaceae bacterium]